MADPLQHDIFTLDQIHAYYDRISLPQEWRIKPGEQSAAVAKDHDRGLAFLTVLQRHHLAAVPFENLDLHYNRHHQIFIDPPHLFDKIVMKGNGRGGYCMETNGLFGTILRTLGFDIYPTGARVYTAGVPLGEASEPKFNGWTHMVHIVIFGTKKYHVDVGFGTSGPTSPLLLDETSVTPSVNISPQMKRLRRTPIPESTRKHDANQMLWVYEVQNQPDSGPWVPCYCFSELEFVATDFEIMNFWTSQSPRLWFSHDVVCQKMVLEDKNIVGTVSVYKDGLKRRKHGNVTLNTTLFSETQRIQALEEHLGVTLTEDEQAGIRGYSSEIQ